ncbi:ABC transporter ATP-binding protein [Stetteria hydrogenophila]
MVEVRLESVYKTFGRTAAVNGVTLTFRDGEFTVILGPSGCGKTTTLRIIAGLEKPDRGRVLFGGRDVTHLPPRKRNVSMVFQSYALWPHMKVRDNIAFPLRIRKVPESEVARRVKWAAELLGIEELLDRYPSQLSGGQRQRVAVARAIVVEPDVMLMDEPLSNLDAVLRVRMRSELKKLQRRLGVTTIYVTHDQVEAMTMGDRVAVMNEGRIMQVGTPEEVYERPANTFVATFVGSPQMNLVKAVVRRAGGELVLDAGDFKLPAPPSLKAGEGAEVLVGIRPEHFTLQPGGGPAVEGVIDFVERLGSDTILHVNTGSHVVTVKIPGGIPASAGEKVTIYPRLDKVRVYDASTGELVS